MMYQYLTPSTLAALVRDTRETPCSQIAREAMGALIAAVGTHVAWRMVLATPPSIQTID